MKLILRLVGLLALLPALALAQWKPQQHEYSQYQIDQGPEVKQGPMAHEVLKPQDRATASLIDPLLEDTEADGKKGAKLKKLPYWKYQE